MSRPINRRPYSAGSGDIAWPTASDTVHGWQSLILLGSLECHGCFPVETVRREVGREVSGVDTVLAVLIKNGIVRGIARQGN